MLTPNDEELLRHIAEARERNAEYLSTVFGRARQRYMHDAEFHAVCKGVNRVVEDYKSQADGAMDDGALAMLTVMVADDLRESLKEQRLPGGDQEFCPFDCDSCHGDDCPCTRLGCEGNPL